MKEKRIEVGLIKGRHPLPVKNYIFDEEIENVFDEEFLSKTIKNFLNKNIKIEKKYELCLAQADYTDIERYVSKERLVVYVTGLTIVTAELIKMCAYEGVSLSLMNYDRETDSYVEQFIF